MTVATLLGATVVETSSPMREGVELILHSPEAAARAKPGQFFQLAVEGPQTLLGRPYSIAWADPDRGTVGFLFSVVGAGSAWLGARQAGQPVELLGPLGAGFDLSRNQGMALCVAGGLGIAPFPGLVAQLAALERTVIVLQGARTADRLLPASRVPLAEMRVATDDGSAGHQGLVTDLLRDVISPDAELFACGPTSMLQAVVRFSRRVGFPLKRIQVALETPMGCGLGTCLGCAAPARAGGYLLTCQQGPCLTADRIDWERMTDAFH